MGEARDTGEGCCAPGRASGSGRAARPAAGAPPARRHELVPIPGGPFLMGSEDPLAYPQDGEGPVHRVRLEPFLIDPHAVSNDRFAEFVAATGHVTDAEQWGASFVFQGLLPEHTPPTRAVAQAPWWRLVPGTAWRCPEGPGTGLAGRGDHPVVHVSHNDAAAYCAWAGVRLPSEAEWEMAARGGLSGEPFPWGAELEPGGRHMMNVWQGPFPERDTADDGYAGTAPVDAYPPNAHGLHNVTGNVWEWTADWFDPGWYAAAPEDGTGPPSGERRVTRGGSYLCHASYCRRYRVSARGSNLPQDATGNIGFRVAADAIPG